MDKPTVTVIVPTMEGITTAIVAFIFICVIWPHLVKNKTQFYAAFTAVLLIILLSSLSVMIGSASGGFQVFAGAATGLLQLAAIVLLFSGAGGISVKQLTGEMARAYEVMRRGEEEKTVVIPISGQQPKPRESGAGTGPGAVEDIHATPNEGWPTKKPGESSSGSLPLE
jgi:hypothetical protein